MFFPVLDEGIEVAFFSRDVGAFVTRGAHFARGMFVFFVPRTRKLISEKSNVRIMFCDGKCVEFVFSFHVAMLLC